MKEDEKRILYPYKDVLIIKANVANKILNSILVDSRNSVDIFFKFTLDEMRITDVKQKKRCFN